MDQDPIDSPPLPNLATDTANAANRDASVSMDDDGAWHSTKQISEGYHVLEYDGAAHVYGHGLTSMDKFNADKYASIRKTQLYYPFASRAEWELASFLMESSLSMAAIDRFLKLELVRSKKKLPPID